MPDKDPAAVFDATGDGVAEQPATAHRSPEDRAAEAQPAGDGDADVTETLADRQARAARIRERSVELVEALGADHPLVAEALARADALDRVTEEHTQPSEHPSREATAASDIVDLRSSAHSPH